MITVGQQLGGYTILKRIGGGQMGEVFLAQHRRIARRAAIKTLIPELSAKEAVIERFFKEARNTSQIRNPAIVEILDCDVQDGQAYVIMEFLEGESLGTYLKRVGSLEPDMAFLLGVMGATASAVGAAHEVGIMHRDLKPENIYLQLASPASPTVTVKALDFGISQLSRSDGGPSKTSSGVLLGAPAYMSPEQCRGSGRTDERSDIYSLGCVLYEALCGRPPFTSNALGDLIVAHVSEPPKAPSKLVPDVPPKLNALILKMLAKAPDDRPASMKAVVDALRDCARGLGIDFETPLEPLGPIERPVLMAEGAPVVASAPEASKAVRAPAPAYPMPSSPAMPAPSEGASRFAAAPSPVFAPPVAAPAQPAFSAPPQPAFSAPPPARPPASEGALPAPMFPQPSAGAVGRTLILDPSMDQGLLPPRRETGDPLARLKGLAGQTVMMPDDELARAVVKGEQLAKAKAKQRGVRPSQNEAPRGMAGGTQVLDIGNAAPGSDDDDEREEEEQDEQEEEEEVRATEHVSGRKGGRRAERAARNAMPAAGTPSAGVPANAEPPSSFADFARANPRLLVFAGGAVVLLIAVLAIVLSRPSKKPRAKHEASHGEQAAPEAPPPPAKEPEPALVAPAVPAPEAPAATPTPTPPTEDNVRINLKRVPEGTEISVDGHPTTLPILVPRGRETHQIILRWPDGTERSIDVDGTRDRLIELAAPRPTGGAHATKPPAPPTPPRPPAAEPAAKAPAPAHAPASTVSPKEPAAHAPTAPKPVAPPAATPRPSALAPAAKPPATPPGDKKKPRVSKEREAIIDL